MAGVKASLSSAPSADRLLTFEVSEAAYALPIEAVLEVAKSVDTAKMHWKRLRRVTRMMMMLRTSGAVRQSGGVKLAALAKMMRTSRDGGING